MTKHKTLPMMRALTAAIRANVPTLMWGNPGVGKTAKLDAYGQAWGYHVETMVGSIREPSDFMGLPIANADGTVDYAPLSWAQRLRDAEKGLLFLDELSTSSPSVQRAMLRIAQEREVGELRLPDSVAIVAAANPPEIAVDGWDLAAPIANRFMHLNWVFDSEEWLDGVLDGFTTTSVPTMTEIIGKPDDVRRAVVHASVTSFLRQRPDLLNPTPPTDPTTAGRAWPSPRSWTNAMSVLSELPQDDDEAARLVVMGCVGEGAAREYLAWEATLDLIDPMRALMDPTLVNWKGERPDRLFALVSAVTIITQQRGAKADWERCVALLVACAKGGKPDVAMPSARKILNQRPDGVKIPAEARSAFSDILQRSGRLAAA